MEHSLGSSRIKGIELSLFLAIGYFLKKKLREVRKQEMMCIATERLDYFLEISRCIRI